MAAGPKYEANTLPGHIKKRNVRIRKEKQALQSKLPQWVRHPATLQRVFRTYELYNKRTPIAKIVELQRISIRAVYDDIERARAFAVVKFQEDLRHCIVEQVEARKLLINDARTAIEELYAGARDGGGEGQRRRNTFVDDGGEIRTMRDDGVEQRVGRIGPLAANSIAQLMKVISENEKAVEELLLLRSKSSGSVDGGPFDKLLNSGGNSFGPVSEPGGQKLLPGPSEPGGQQTFTVIDARTYDVDESVTTLSGNSASGTIGDEFQERGRADGKKVRIIEGEYA